MKERRRRDLADLHVLRYVPGTSPVHRVWAGTKILAITVVSLGLILWPTWQATGLAGVVVLSAFLFARLPSGVLPRVPRWIWIMLLVGVFLALVAGGKPRVHLGGVAVGLGGLAVWTRLTLIGIEVLALAAVVSWTTPLSELAPALGRLGSPLRRLRLPVDELVSAIALGIRCLPLLIEEVRVLGAARRTRRPEPPRSMKERADALEELIYTALASALRRASEMAEAIEARGGVSRPIAETHPFKALDGAMLTVCALAVSAMGVLR